MRSPTIAPAWPEPYLQPDRHRDCTFYAAAYLARCLGRLETTAQDVMDWRVREGRYEHMFLVEMEGVETQRWWQVHDDDQKRARFWLGQGTRPWVEQHLSAGWIGYVHLHRIKEMTHAVVLLDSDDSGVLLMDPIFGHVIEPWDWFLGLGPGIYGSTMIEGWHRTVQP